VDEAEHRLMETLGSVLRVMGAVCFVLAAMNAPRAPNGYYLFGSFLPGVIFVAVGLLLRPSRTQTARAGGDGNNRAPAAADSESPENASESHQTRARAFRLAAALGIGCGIVLMLLGWSIGADAHGALGPLFAALVASFGGYSLLMWGCVNYARWKGYSGWWGAFGYLVLLGLLILLALPNRRKGLLRQPSESQLGRFHQTFEADRRPGYRFLVLLVPVVVLPVVLGARLLQISSNARAEEWTQLAPPRIGFEALVPGTANAEHKTQPTQAGTIELHKFAAVPRGKKELFMIVAARFPDELTRALGTNNLLEAGCDDVVSASQGHLETKQDIALDGVPGRELLVVPPKGAVIKARVFAAGNWVYELSVHVPIIRLDSDDVEKFFGSFRWTPVPGPAREDSSH
jgi:hypothetical protein